MDDGVNDAPALRKADAGIAVSGATDAARAAASIVLLTPGLSILIFNFYPSTAVMIVLLALLNDAANLSIAYDKVHCSNKPEAWNMPLVMGIASVLSVTGVIASFAQADALLVGGHTVGEDASSMLITNAANFTLDI